MVMRRPADPRNVDSAIIAMLLDLKDPRPVRWPFDGRVLVIEGEEALRRLFVNVLEYAGAGCYGVGTPARAVRLLEADHGIGFVIHDFDMPRPEVAASVAKIQAVRPDVEIVGTSARPRPGDFAAYGVERSVRKPWMIHDLINALRDRIGDCVECGVTLPLRRPKADEPAKNWVCTVCGARYSGLLDEDHPAEVMQNVSPGPTPEK